MQTDGLAVVKALKVSVKVAWISVYDKVVPAVVTKVEAGNAMASSEQSATRVIPTVYSIVKEGSPTCCSTT